MLTSHNLLQPLGITATDVKVFHSVRKESLNSWTAAVRCWLVGWKSSSPFAAPFTHALLAVFFPYQFSFVLSMFSNYFFPLKTNSISTSRSTCDMNRLALVQRHWENNHLGSPSLETILQPSASASCLKVCQFWINCKHGLILWWKLTLSYWLVSFQTVVLIWNEAICVCCDPTR